MIEKYGIIGSIAIVFLEIVTWFFVMGFFAMVGFAVLADFSTFKPYGWVDSIKFAFALTLISLPVLLPILSQARGTTIVAPPVIEGLDSVEV